MDKVKNYRGVYTMLFKTTAKYYSRTPLMRMSEFTTELSGGYDKYIDRPGFPGRFYEALSDALVGWFMHRFSGCDGVNGLQNDLNAIWKLHKPFLEMDAIDEDALNKAADMANKLIRDIFGDDVLTADMNKATAMKNLCAAVLLDLRDTYEEQNKAQSEDESGDENAS